MSTSRSNAALCRMGLLCAAAALGFMPQLANATENGTTEYPLGADSFNAGITPPPGHGVLLSYDTYFNAALYAGGARIKGSHAGVFVSAYRGIYTWPVAYDDGKITLSSEIVIGGGHIGLKVPLPGGAISNGSAGMVDPSFWPVAVNYHSGPVFICVTMPVWAPLGTYNKTAAPAKGLGLNHWTFGPAAYLTYIASPKWQFDVDTLVEINTINPQTQYHSGADSTVTASASYRLLSNLQIGPTAWVYEQLTNDTQYGHVYNKGNKGQTLALGMQAIYSIGHGGILLKYYHDTLVRNRAGGDQVWLQWALPF